MDVYTRVEYIYNYINRSQFLNLVYPHCFHFLLHDVNYSAAYIISDGIWDAQSRGNVTANAQRKVMVQPLTETSSENVAIIATAPETASDQADGRHVANQNTEGTVVTPNTDEPEPPPASTAHHTHPANEVEESGELITDVGSMHPASENYDNIPHENVQTFLKNIRSLTGEQKYHLLKHHARMPHDYVFPSRYIAGCNRRFNTQ